MSPIRKTKIRMKYLLCLCCVLDTMLGTWHTLVPLTLERLCEELKSKSLSSSARSQGLNCHLVCLALYLLLLAGTQIPSVRAQHSACLTHRCSGI